MDIISLPHDLSQDDSAKVQLFDYHISKAQLKNKINLTQNTFSFLIEGTKEVVADDKSVLIKNDEFLILKSGNCLMTENVSDSNKTYRSILLFFTDDILFQFVEKYDIINNQSSIPAPFQVCEYDHYINHFVRTLEEISHLNVGVQQKLLAVKFEELMVYLMEIKGVDFLLSLIESQDPKSRNFIKVVESNKLSKLTVSELAFLCFMSLSTFKREFEKHYQTSPIKWFQDKRLEHSAFLLKTHRKRPIEIYSEIGYDTLSSFIQAFKKKYGATPKQYQMQK